MGKRKSTPTSLTMKMAAAGDSDYMWQIKQDEPVDWSKIEPVSPVQPSPSPGESLSPASDQVRPNGYSVNGMNALIQSIQPGATKNFMDYVVSETGDGLGQSPGVNQLAQSGTKWNIEQGALVSTKNLMDYVVAETTEGLGQSPGSVRGDGTPTGNMDRHYWSEEETNLLMELYVKNLTRFKERRHTGITIWEEIAQEIKETLGVVVTGDQCHSKLRNMKRTFIRATARGPLPPDTSKDQQLVMKGTGGSMQKVTVPAPLAEMFASSLPVNFTNPSSFPQIPTSTAFNSISGLDIKPKPQPHPFASILTQAPPKLIHNRTPTLVRHTNEVSTQTCGKFSARQTYKNHAKILKLVRRQQVENRLFHEQLLRENREQFALVLRQVSDLSQSVQELKRAIHTHT